MFGVLIPPSPVFKSVPAPSPCFARAPASTRMSITCAATCHAPPSMPPQFADFAPLTAPRKPGASLYEVLRVEKNASQTQIKAAYRTLAKLYHPDATSQADSDGRDFMEIHNAYETLSDPAARALYDLSLERLRRRPAVAGFYTTRRWETDQCW